MKAHSRILVLLAVAAAGATSAAPVAGHSGQTEACSLSARAVPQDSAGRPINLTGTWTANDGGTYWLRQVGSCLWWTGFSGPVDSSMMGRSFANVFFGTITQMSVSGWWADVPRGATLGNGTLTLAIKLDSTRRLGRLYKVRATGSAFGATVWTLH
jgi:hypothetical protein